MGLWPHGVDHLSGTTHALLQAQGGLPAVLSISGQCPRARGVDQLSLATQARVRGPKGSTSSPGRLVSGCDSLRFRQALPGDSDQCPSARDVDQLSWATHVRVRGPVRSTRCPALPGLLSEVRRGPPAPPGDSRSGPRVRGVDQLSRAIGLGSDGLQSRPAVLEDSRQAPMARRLDHMSRGTWGRVPVPAVSNSSPGRLGAMSEARDINQLYRTTRAQVRGPMG